MQESPRQHGTGQQFPETGEGREKIRDWIDAVNIQVQSEGNHGEQGGNGKKIEPFFPGQPKKERPDDIKLFLDPQTPEMQKRFGFSCLVEIAAFEPEQDIGNEPGTPGNMFAQLGILTVQHEINGKKTVAEQKQCPERETGDQNCNQDRINAADASAVKLPERKRAIFKLRKNNGRNQKTGNDEKNIDADETATYDFGKSVKEKYREHGQSPETVNIGAITGRFGMRLFGRCGRR